MGLLKNLNWVGKLCRISSWLMFLFLGWSILIMIISQALWGGRSAFESWNSIIGNLFGLSSFALYGWIGFFEKNPERLKIGFSLASLFFIVMLMF